MTRVRITRCECLVLVEDLGRPGYAHLGVSRSGALDPDSLSLANRLVGNEPDVAGLEILLGGISLVADTSLLLSLTGSPLLLRVGGQVAPVGVAVPVPAGTTIDVEPAYASLRSWLAFAGGIDVPAVLGSRSRDTLGGLGPPPLRAGLTFGLGRSAEPAAYVEGLVGVTPQTGGTTLSVDRGPRADLFDEEATRRFLAAPYRVTPSSDRVALRLAGPDLHRRDAGVRASEGMVNGAVQIAGDGQPLVFLADHPTTGGYPVIAVVDDDSLRRAAQLRPGDVVRFI